MGVTLVVRVALPMGAAPGFSVAVAMGLWSGAIRNDSTAGALVGVLWGRPWACAGVKDVARIAGGVVACGGRRFGSYVRSWAGVAGPGG